MQELSSPDTDFMAFANLHDVFLNVTICRSNMRRARVVEGVEAFLVSDRARFERMWVTFLYVLVEAWRSRAMRGARSYMMSRAPTLVWDIERIIAEGEKDGSIAKMRDVPDYMCHRDTCSYWDAGRVDIAGQLAYHEAVGQAFSAVFLEVVKRDNAR